MALTNNQALVNYLIRCGVLKTSSIIRAFLKIDRADFVLPEYQDEAYQDYPLPIGYGATISQPYTVAFMLELLQLQKGEKILDLGSGSGWTTALLAEIVGKKGKVFGVEIVPELVGFGKKNLKKYGLQNAKIVKAESSLGLTKEAPFDKILVSAAAQNLPQELLDQLKAPGRLVMPIGGSLWKIEKDNHSDIQQEEYPGFMFVPLILDNR